MTVIKKIEKHCHRMLELVARGTKETLRGIAKNIIDQTLKIFAHP